MPYKEESLLDGRALTPGNFSLLRKLVYDLFPFTCVVGMGFDECEVTHEEVSLDGVDELGRSFGLPSDSCPESPATPETSGVGFPMKNGCASGAMMLFTTLAVASASF